MTEKAKDARGKFFVLEAQTAAQDGIYTSRDVAMGAADYLRKKHPWGVWLVFEGVDLSQMSGRALPRFHATYLECVPPGLSSVEDVRRHLAQAGGVAAD